MANALWHLYRTNEQGLALQGTWPTLAEVARKIIDTEAIPLTGLAFRLHVDIDAASDEQILADLEYSGKHGSYVIRKLLA